MHVDWDWAKQRPHFLAEHLSIHHDVIVFYPFALARGNLVKNDSTKVNLLPFFPIASTGRFPPIRRIINLAAKIMIKIVINWHRVELVWISSPELFSLLPKTSRFKLIYDCMDDILAFPGNASRARHLRAQEAALVSASDLVFCSSDNLRQKLEKRTCLVNKFITINNACQPSAFPIFDFESPRRSQTEKTRVIGYIGTISSWLDFDSLLRIVDKYECIEIHLLGPIESRGADVIRHKRIRYYGPLRHSELSAYARLFDALILPFKVTELITSVDPVKLYEYILFNKPILSIRYQEIERFSEFVDFYTDQQELIQTLQRYICNNFSKKYSEPQRIRFLHANTWAQRITEIEECMLDRCI